MARRTICVMPARADEAAIAARDCRRREHRHLTEQAARELVLAGEAEWISGSVVRSKTSRRGSDLSLRVGEWVAMGIYTGQPIGRAVALEILAHVRR